MAPQNDMITVLHLRKGYRHKEVLRDVTFSVPSGTTFALLGSNGAGKTTTIRILTTQLKPDGGKITVAGYDVARDPRRIHESISLTGQFSAVDEALTGRENMVIMGKLRQLPDPRKDAAELLDYFGLTASADQPVSSYSGGMKRKLDIAMSLPGKPKIIFLDEPTTGLDPQSRRAMWDMIKELNRSGITVFLTTQYLEEAEQLADHIAILDKGMIIAEGTPGELKAYLPRGAVEFVFGFPGALTGFRPSASPAGWITVLILLTGTILAMSWLSAVIGIAAHSAEGANAFSSLVIILPYLSSGFVPADSLPAALQFFARHQPMTSVIDTLRAALLGTSVNTSLFLTALAWCAGMTIIFRLISLALFGKRFSR